MPTTITFNVKTKTGSKPATINVSNKNVIKYIFPNLKNNNISETQLNQLQGIAKRGGDLGVIEDCDLNSRQKMEQAKINGYDEFYDIKLSKDGKFYEITVKPTSMLYPDPKIFHIKKDFGLKENVFLENNRNLVGSNPDDPESGNFDFNKLPGGTTFKIPVEEAHFTNGPSGFFGRIIAVG